MKKKFLRGEITTAFTASIILGLTLFSLASQYFLLKRQPIKTKAAGAVASLDCIQKINDKNYLFFKGADPVCERDKISQGTYAWLVGDKRCVVDKPETCEPPQGFESGEKWCYYFGNSYQNSRCMVRDVSCDNASCFGGSSGSSGSGSGSGGGSGGGNAGSTSGAGVSNGCFSLKAEFEAKDEGNKKAFYAWVTFESNRGGDVKLEEAGQHVAGWNSFAGGSFTYDPNWSQHWRPGSWIAVGTLTKGQSYTVYYRGMLSGCNPQDVSLSCNLVYNTNGSASVSGNGCFCRNCGGGSTPPSSATGTPTLKPDQNGQQKPPLDNTGDNQRVDYAQISGTIRIIGEGGNEYRIEIHQKKEEEGNFQTALTPLEAKNGVNWTWFQAEKNKTYYIKAVMKKVKSINNHIITYEDNVMIESNETKVFAPANNIVLTIENRKHSNDCVVKINNATYSYPRDGNPHCFDNFKKIIICPLDKVEAEIKECKNDSPNNIWLCSPMTNQCKRIDQLTFDEKNAMGLSGSESVGDDSYVVCDNVEYNQQITTCYN